MSELQSHLFQEPPSVIDQHIHSFHPQTVQSRSYSLSSYLHSDPSEAYQPTYNSEPTQVNSSMQLMSLEERNYLLCPQIYQSFRNQTRISEVKGDSFKLIKYNKGRTQLIFRDCLQIELPRVASLTYYRNRDYRLVNNDMVYFWHQTDKYLEKYCVTV